MTPVQAVEGLPAKGTADVFESGAKPMIRCCFAYESGFPLQGYEDQWQELPNEMRRLFYWESIPINKGRACVQLNRAARGLHYRIREVQNRAVTCFEGVATMVSLPLYQEGTILAEVHLLRPRPGLQLQDILEWLLAEYLLEFEGYDKRTFIDWIVGRVHLSPNELGGANVLEDWYRERAKHIGEQGREDDGT